MPDEPFYSLAARYHELLGYESYHSTSSDLLGTTHASFDPELPNRLGWFLSRAAWVFPTRRQFIERHTAAPYHGLFLDTEGRRGLQEVLLDPAPPSPVALLGLAAAKVLSPPALRYCVACAKKDREQNEFAYWRRVHQSPGVVACNLHGTWLVESEVLRANRRCRNELVTLDHVVGFQASSLRSPYQSLIDIASDTNVLLNLGTGCARAEDLRRVVLARYQLIGWATRGGTLRSQPIRDAWALKFPRVIRKQMACGIENLEDPIPFLRSLTKGGSRKVHPLVAIMLVQITGSSISSVIDDANQLPAAKRRRIASRPCENGLCPDAGSARSTSTQLDSRGRRVQVLCGECGQRYEADAVSPSRRRVLEWGHIWDHALETLVRSGNASQRSIARTLGVDPRTVRRAAQRLGLQVSWVQEPKRGQAHESAHELDKKRTQWTGVRCLNPKATRAELREREPGLWAWLYRNDRRWLFGNVPAETKRSAPRDRVNWGTRDQQLCLKLEQCAQSILLESGRPIQITRAELARRVGTAGLFSKKVIKRLPQTAALADKVVESRLDFAARRIEWVAARCIADGYAAKPWELGRLAALRNDLWEECRDRLESASESVMATLHSQSRG